MRTILCMAAFLLCAIGVIAISNDRVADAGEYAYKDIKRNVRIALGLPKNWVTTFNDDPSSYEPTKCPDNRAIVIVTGGQSNAANEFSAPSADYRDANTFMFFANRCYRLRSPVLGATGTNGSLWPALGEALHRRTGRPVVFINGAVGGSQLGDWLDDRSHYLDRLSGNAVAARKQGLDPDFVFWIQGETDAAVKLDPDRFVSEIKELVATLDKTGAVRAATPWVFFRSTRCKHRPNNGPELDAAVTAFTRHSDRVTAGPLASALDDSYRRDDCHFNARGRAALVTATMRMLEARFPQHPKLRPQSSHGPARPAGS